GRMPRAAADKLSALGHRVSVTGDWSNASAPTVIQIVDDGQGQRALHGGADPRRARFIFGR
ncbi:MAG: gamma-glutamyltransferase, partial [Candidatus Solibacter usitatus]|nr:gamma-glutamyltransferase [Candidatus Solibacter usitatus]